MNQSQYSENEGQLFWPKNRVFRIWPNTLIGRISIGRIASGAEWTTRPFARPLWSTAQPCHPLQQPFLNSAFFTRSALFVSTWPCIIRPFKILVIQTLGHVSYSANWSLVNFFSANWNSAITILTDSSLESFSEASKTGSHMGPWWALPKSQLYVKF